MRSLLGLVLLFATMAHAQPPAFHVLAFYSETVEHDHVYFAHQAIVFYSRVAKRGHFDFTTTTH